MSARGWLLGAAMMGALAGCQTTGQPVPAVLESGDPASMERLKAALAKAVGRASVELGPGDPTRTSSLSVLPRRPGPLEGNSPAMPTIFRLEIDNGACFVAREDGAGRELVAGVTCRPAG